MSCSTRTLTCLGGRFPFRFPFCFSHSQVTLGDSWKSLCLLVCFNRTAGLVGFSSHGHLKSPVLVLFFLNCRIRFSFFQCLREKKSYYYYFWEVFIFMEEGVCVWASTHQRRRAVSRDAWIPFCGVHGTLYLKTNKWKKTLKGLVPASVIIRPVPFWYQTRWIESKDVWVGRSLGWYWWWGN